MLKPQLSYLKVTIYHFRSNYNVSIFVKHLLFFYYEMQCYKLNNFNKKRTVIESTRIILVQFNIHVTYYFGILCFQFGNLDFQTYIHIYIYIYPSILLNYFFIMS